MPRAEDFEVLKKQLNEDLSLAEALEVADELVEHVEYWQNAERSGTNFLTKKLKGMEQQLKDSEKLINEYIQIGQRTDAMIEARDKEIERLKIKLEAYRELERAGG